MEADKFQYDPVRGNAPVSAGTLWDLLIDQDQLILTLLQVVLSVKQNDEDDFLKYSKEFMERSDALAKMRDRLVTEPDQ